jgi:glucose-1-phosphate cytidylyltransferase
MKVVLFCGGLGMRIREAGDDIPKPMVPIGYRPILWHLEVLRPFRAQRLHLCLGHRADVIKNISSTTRKRFQRTTSCCRAAVARWT